MKADSVQIDFSDLINEGYELDLTAAIANLNWGIEIGITEYFNLTLEYWKDKGHLKSVKYTSQNVNRHPRRQQELGQRLINLIKDMNYLDIKLYNYAKELFFQRLLAHHTR